MKSVGDIEDLEEWIEVSMKYFEIIAAHQSLYTISDIRELTFPQGFFHMMELIDRISEEQQLGKFWETASANRGFTHSKVFFDFDEGESLLISKIPK